MVEISAHEFNVRCLELLGEVADSGVELLITKRGRPVARVVPIDTDESLLGTVRQLVDDDELIEPVGTGW